MSYSTPGSCTCRVLLLRLYLPSGVPHIVVYIWHFASENLISVTDTSHALPPGLLAIYYRISSSLKVIQPLVTFCPANANKTLEHCSSFEGLAETSVYWSRNFAPIIFFIFYPRAGCYDIKKIADKAIFHCEPGRWGHYSNVWYISTHSCLNL